MAKRRMSGYGTAPLPKMGPSGAPLPPPPDGKPPVRLPFRVSERPPMEDTTGQSDDQMLQLLKVLQRGA